MTDQNDITPAEQARLAASIDTNQATAAALEEQQQTAEARATALHGAARGEGRTELTTLTTPEERAAKYVRCIPPAVSGQGGHDATYRVACLLTHGFALDAEAALALLRDWNTRCQPPWSERELHHKIRSALASGDPMHPRGYLLQDGATHAAASWMPRPLAPRPKPTFDAGTLARIARKLDGIDAEWLAERSPICPDNQTPANFLQALYRPGEKVVVFDDWQSQGQAIWTYNEPPFDAHELDRFRLGRPGGVWFLTNPVTGAFVANDDGNPSRRSWQSVTSWRYLVLESDKANPEQWLAMLAQMPLAIAAIYTSGGRSIHALIRLDAETKGYWDETVAKMKPYFVTLGADPRAMSAVRLSRLPCCQRGGKLQRLLYLNPDPSVAPLCEKGGE